MKYQHHFFTKAQLLQFSPVQKIAFGSVFTAIGILLPMVFHLFQIGGPVMLPMHIPVLLCGLLLGPSTGLVNGILTPVLSCLLTGMPVLFPMLPIMTCELAIYGLVAGLCIKYTHNMFLGQYAAMLCGRLGYAAVFYLLTQLLSKQIPASISAVAAAATGLPGILLQLLLIPALFYLFHRYLLKVLPINRLLHKRGFTLAVFRHRKMVVFSFEKGLLPLYSLYRDDPAVLMDAVVCDRVTGKAAAFLCAKAGVRAVRSDILSEKALEVLRAAGIGVQYKQLVPYIINRKKDGMCPMEQLVDATEEADCALAALDAFFQHKAALKSGPGQTGHCVPAKRVYESIL